MVSLVGIGAFVGNTSAFCGRAQPAEQREAGRQNFFAAGLAGVGAVVLSVSSLCLMLCQFHGCWRDQLL
jgi:hypothetical protein